MREDARARFAQLERLCAPEVNRTLLQSLRSRARQGEATREMEFVAANLARRAGDLDSARRAFEAYLGAPLQPGVAVPPGLSSGGGFNISPIVAIDGFLPPVEMEALHRHACAIEDRFRVANVNSIAPQRAPDKRDTYITYDFDHLKSFFSDHVAENLPRLCAALGIPDFEVDRTEIKMTCYLDGGFFKTCPAEPSRAAASPSAVTCARPPTLPPPRGGNDPGRSTRFAPLQVRTGRQSCAGLSGRPGPGRLAQRLLQPFPAERPPVRAHHTVR